jgi:hypothetical protein
LEPTRSISVLAVSRFTTTKWLSSSRHTRKARAPFFWSPWVTALSHQFAAGKHDEAPSGAKALLAKANGTAEAVPHPKTRAMPFPDSSRAFPKLEPCLPKTRAVPSQNSNRALPKTRAVPFPNSYRDVTFQPLTSTAGFAVPSSLALYVALTSRFSPGSSEK